MKVEIDHHKAESILRDTVDKVKSGYDPKSKFEEEVKIIILGTHKTYRYIFVNALLAKATNKSANPIILQKGSKLKGAFDARSLCHKVLVKVEREMMENALGGSNEPFLNKPARYKELSMGNAVRKGKDADLLKLCIRVLSSLKNSREALGILKDAVYYSFLRNPARKVSIVTKNFDSEVMKINNFINKLLSKSCGGESCAIVAAMSFEIFGMSQGFSLNVQAHPVNQTGDSSKEISDIDVFHKGHLIYTAEVKDKDYTVDDLDHAAKKVFDIDFDRLLFLKGENAKLVGDGRERSVIKKWAKKGVDIFIGNVSDFFTMQLYFCQDVSMKRIVNMLNNHIKISRASDIFVKHIKESLK